ncbi:hypothetical protein [Sphingopyxis chilensis]
MPRQSKLKLFRTAIGFHDAYVAAPSQKAALEAWGSDSNLFAVGAAERVEDPDMMRETFDSPGRVIKRPRGTMAEHMAALPKTRASPRAKRKPDMGQEDAPHAGKGARAAKPEALPAKPKPRPNHAPVQRAEAALADAEERHEEERSALAKQQAELDRARRKLEAAQVRERERLEHRLEAARDSYERAMRAWRVS